MAGISNKHHYIPIFFTKGFANEDGCVFVYDKEIDIVHYRRRSPSSVFFDLGRNIGKVHDKEFDEIETVQFGKLDNITSKIIELLRKNEDPRSLLDANLMVQLGWFANNLCWRLPVNDEKFNKIYSTLEIDPEDIVGDTKIPVEEIVKIDFFKKATRAIIPFAKFNLANDPVETESDLIKLPIKFLLLSDNPVVYRKEPNMQFDAYRELVLAIGADMLFIVLKKGQYKEMNSDILLYYNLLVVHQAKRYVVSHDLDTLGRIVELYRQYKRESDSPSAERLFNLINGDYV